MDKFQKTLQETGVYGEVVEIRYPLVSIKGLPKVRPNETIIFDNGAIGSVFDIDKNLINALVFSKEPPTIHSQASPLKESLGVEVGNHLIGSVIDPLGLPFNGGEGATSFGTTKKMSLFSDAPGIDRRLTIKEPFLTGQIKVDLLLPLGKGQRELILGDSKTGKTSLILSIIETQAIQEKNIIIYAGIGKKASEISSIVQYIHDRKISDRSVVVASTSSDNSSLAYITPFTAMTVAEYFAKQGNDVTLILDDLSTHAARYREIALLSKRFPGRESYPGDIFYIHASLLERAGNFKSDNNKSFSITCLPIASTVEGDITGYISTNLMSITDGHILFDSDIYNKGQRPAINIPLSVTRVGRQTQTELLREITVEILSSLSQYEKMKNITHLGSELSNEAQEIIAKGSALEVALQQDLNIINKSVQVIIFALVMINSSYFSNLQNYLEVFKEVSAIYNTTEGKAEIEKVAGSVNIKELLKNVESSAVLSPLCRKGQS